MYVYLSPSSRKSIGSACFASYSVHVVPWMYNKNNTETNQNDTYTNYIFGIYTITICKDIK